MRREVSLPIDAPAELVWQTISDVEQWPEWTPTMTEIRRLDEGAVDTEASSLKKRCENHR